MTTTKIREQLESYRDATWKLDHHRAIECYDFDDWLAFGLSLLGGIRTIDEQYHERIADGRLAFKRDIIEGIQALYEIWCSPCEHLLRGIGEFEREGYRLDNAAAFRAACFDSQVIGFDPQRLARAATQFTEGRGRPLGEALDAVRRRAIP